MPGPAGTEALGRLLARYQAFLRAHLVLHQRVAPDRADDLLQGFIADKVMRTGLIASASRGRGRFRSYLLLALRRYASNQRRNDDRHVRSPESLRPLADADDVPDPRPPPDDSFHIDWARELLAHVARQMHDDCATSRRGRIWTVFHARVLSPALDGGEPVPYERLVAELHLPSVDAASNLLVTGKRMFLRSLRAAVGEYIDGQPEIDEEIADLRELLSRARA